MALTLVLAACAVGGVLYLDATLLSDLPEDFREYAAWRPPTTVHILAADGTPVDQIYLERREWVAIETLPDHVWQAFVAAEDRRFFEHPGVDLQGIARALYINTQSGESSQGGSTLTQQLAKNLIVGKEKSYERKIREAVVAYRLDSQLGKEQILELYINYVFLGAGNYGIEAAAQDYFGRPSKDLDAGQAALIAGLVPAPSRWQPRRNPEAAAWRRALVLGEMVEVQYLSSEEAATFLDDEVLVPAASGPRTGVALPYVTQTRREVRRLFGDRLPFDRGFTVQTALDLTVQRVAEAAVRDAVDAVNTRQKHPTGPDRFVDGAAVVIENATGRVVAITGGYETTLEGFVRGAQARRQPGSSFKPYVYAAALSSGRRQTDTELDGPISFPAGGGATWSPRNYSGGYAGTMTLRRALASSSNTVAVRLAVHAGPGEVARLAHAMGVSSPLRRDLTLALGSSEVTPLDQAVGYSTIARMGLPIDPVFIDRITDVDGQEVARAGGPTPTGDGGEVWLPGAPRPRALDAGVAYELADMLREVVHGGTARRAYEPTLDRAGKTGTTNDFKDAWFVGFTPEHTIAIWIGTDGSRSLGPSETGGRAALPAWLAIAEALGPIEGQRLPMPDDAMLVKTELGWLAAPRGLVGRSLLALDRRRPLGLWPKDLGG